MKLSFRHWPLTDQIALAATGIGTWLSVYPAPMPLFTWWEAQACSFMCLLLAGGLLCFFINRTRLAFIAFGGCAVLAYSLHERYGDLLPPSPSSPAAFHLRVASFEAPAEPAELSRFLPVLSENDAHILALERVSTSCLPHIHSFLEDLGYTRFQFYPHGQRHEALAVYSRLPLTVEPLYGQAGFAGMSGRLRLGDLTDSLQALHFLYLSQFSDGKPLTDTSSTLHALTAQLKRQEIPTLIMGDFPLVPWAQRLQFFLRRASLLDSHRKLRPATRQGRLTIFDQPEAHILYSNHFKCISFEPIGSDAGVDIGILGVYQLRIRPNRSST